MFVETTLSFEDRLKKKKQWIPTKKIYKLATEIYKVKNVLVPDIMKGIFQFFEMPYNLRKNSTLKRRCNWSVYLGTETMSSLSPKIWEYVSIKNATWLGLFKKEIKIWKTDKCPCMLCKIHVSSVGLVNTFDFGGNNYFAGVILFI